MRRRTALYLALGVLIALFVFARLHLLVFRLYDPDEFEHLHAGFSVAEGLAPYREFFEHHPPITYWMSAAIFRAVGPILDVLTIHRLISFALAIATALATGVLTRALYSSRAGWWAVFGMLTFPGFVEKSVEWRPDVIATACITWAAVLCVRFTSTRISSARTRVFAFLAGLLVGMALFTTPKSLFLALGLALGAIWTLRSRPWDIVMSAIFGALGLFSVAGIVVAVLAIQGALADAWACLVELPLRWPHVGGIPDYVFGRLWWAPGHVLAAILGVLLSIQSLARRDEETNARAILFLPILCHAIGWFLVPAAYFQYHMLAVPILASLTAGELDACWERLSSRSPSSDASAQARILLALGFIAILWFGLGMWQRREDLWAFQSPYAVVDVSAAIVFVLGCTSALLWPRISFAILLAGLTMPALGRVAIPHFYWSNRAQRAELELINRLVAPDEAVRDGFTGLGFLRPHADYFWWRNEHTLKIERALGPNVTPVGRYWVAPTHAPALIILDEHLGQYYAERPAQKAQLLRDYAPVGVIPGQTPITLWSRTSIATTPR